MKIISETTHTPHIQMSSCLKAKKSSSHWNSTYPVSGGNSPLLQQEKKDECSSFTSFPKVLTQQCPPIRLSTTLNILDQLRTAFARRTWRKKTPQAISKEEFKRSFYRRPNAEELAGGARIHVFTSNAYARCHSILCLHWSYACLCENKKTRLLHPPSTLCVAFKTVWS